MIITKKPEKSQDEITDNLRKFIQSVADCPQDQLPSYLRDNLEWDGSKGNLVNWIPVLNRFDSILEFIINKYNFTEKYSKPALLDEDDIKLVTALVDFSGLLLKQCTNKSLYASTHRMYDLLNTPSTPVVISILKVFIILGKKFSVKTSKRAFVATRQVSDRIYPMALLIPSSTLTANIGSNDDHTLIDFLSGRKHTTPKKWKQLEMVYYPDLDDNSNKITSHTNQPKNDITRIDDADMIDSSQAEKTSGPHSKDSNKDIEGNDTKKKQTPTKDQSRSCTLIISEKDIRKKSMPELLSIGIAKLPKKYWLRFSLRILMTKAFNSNSEESLRLRRELIIIKILSIGLISSVNNEFEVSSRIFEADPSFLTTLIELVNLSNTQIPREIRYAASQTLDCISALRTWSSDIVKGFGGSVSHGLLFQNLRQILKQLKEKDVANIDEDFNRSYFNIITNLVETKPFAAVLISAGLIHSFSEFLTLRINNRRTLYGAIEFLNALCSSNLEHIEVFRETNGFVRIVELIGDELQFALDNPNYDGGPPKYFDVHFTISFKQAAVLRCALEFTQHMIRKESGDGARNLFDSPLLKHVNLILSNVDTFGWTLTTNAISIITEILHNEPTSYTVLKDSGTIDLFINKFENFFGKSALLLTAIPNALGAISLNTEGLEKIKSHNLIKKFFKIFRNHVFAKVLVQDNATEVLSNLLDELARHYPDCKPLITEEIVNLVKELPHFGGGVLPRPEIYSSTNTKSFYLGADEEVVDNEEGAKQIAAWESVDEAYSMENTAVFIGDLIQQSSSWVSLMDAIPIQSWIPLLVLKNSPFDYPYSNCMYPINGALKYFDDERRDYAPRAIVDAIAEQVESTKDYFNSDDTISVFQRLDGDKAASDDLLNRLISANNILFAFVDIYCNPSSLSSARIEQLARLFSDEKGVQLLRNLGKLLERVTYEEHVIRTTMPTSVADETVLTQYDEGFPPLKINLKDSKEDNKHDKTSAKYKNSLQVRFLNQRIHSSISLIFNTLLMVPTSQRQDVKLDQYRGFTVLICDEITKILAGLLDSKHFSIPSFQLVLLNTVHYCLTDSNSDRVLTLGAIMYLQNGGFLKEKELLMHHWNQIKDLDRANVDELKEMTYVKETREGITLGFIIHILVFFNKASSFESLTHLIHSPHFYEGDLSGELPINANNINASFAVQTKLFALGVLLELFNEDGMGSMDEEIKLTDVVVSELVKLGKNIYSASGERHLSQSDGTLFKISWRNVKHSRARIDYLTKLGLTESEVDIIFTDGNGDLTVFNKDNKPSKIEDQSRWDLICEKVKASPYTPPLQEMSPFQYQDYHTISQLEELRSLKLSFVVDQYLLIAQLHERAIPPISEFLLSSFLNNNPKINLFTFQDNILNTILEFIYSFEITNSDSKELASILQLFGSMLKNDHVFFGCHSSLESFVLHFLENLKSEHVNCDWFPKVLYCLQRILAGQELLDMAKPDVNAIIPLPKSIPMAFKLEHSLKDQFFEIVINADEITNNWTALDVTRVLFIYAREPEYAHRIVHSGILKKIIKNVSVFKTDSPERDFALQASVVVLMRRCYETSEVLKVIINREINRQFASKIKKDGPLDRTRDIQSVLKESYGIVLRHPEFFIEEISKRARFIEFSEPLRNLTCRLMEVKEDFPMVDADKTNPASTSSLAANETGIVHLLLTELMDTAKKDWFSDPELTEEEKKAKEEEEKKHEIPKIPRTDIHKNKNCSYMIYLLKLLVELMSSYKQSKLEFLTFSKKANSTNEEPKPRSTSLNFFLHQLVIGPHREFDDAAKQRKKAVYDWVCKAIVAFVSTLESADVKVDPKKVDPDMIFIRRFTVDTVHKVLKDITSSPRSVTICYDRFVSISNVFQVLVKPNADRLIDASTVSFDTYHMAKTIMDTTVTGTMSHILTDIDLNYTDYYFVLESITGVLNSLGEIKTTHQELFKESELATGADEEEVEEDENDYKEETPDLFQNSTLGMYDVAEIDSEDDASEVDEEEEATSDEEGDGLELGFSDGDDDILIDSEEGETVEEDDSEQDDEDDDDEDEDTQDSIGMDYDEDAEDMAGIREIEGSDLDSEMDDYNEGYDGYDQDGEEFSGDEIEEGDFDDMNIQDQDEDGDIDIYGDETIPGDWQVEEEDEEEDEEDSEIEDIFNEVSDDDSPADRHNGHFERRRGMSIRDGDRGLEIEVNSDSEEEDDDASLQFIDATEGHRNLDDLLDTLAMRGRGRIRGRHHHRSRHHNNILEPRQFMVNIPTMMGDGPSHIPGMRRGTLDHFMNIQRFRGLMLGQRRSNAPEFVPKSTRDRHAEVASSLFNKSIDPLRCLVFIVNNIYEPSKELHEAKVREEEERLANQREEEIKKLEERESDIMHELAERAQEEGQHSNAGAEPQQQQEAAANREPVYVMVNGRQVDISGTDIDPEFFEALPDDMREDVLTQHIRERRAEATESGSAIREIDQEFLNALPESMREDILHQEEVQRRLSTLRDRATQSGASAPAHTEGENTANPGELKPNEKHKVFFTPLVDRFGVASLMRFIFIPQSFHGRRSLYELFGQLSINKQTRTEVLGMLLFILKEGINDQATLEKVFNQVSVKARAPSTISSSQTSATSGKNNASKGASASASVQQQRPIIDVSNHFPVRATPFIVSCQVLEALQFLLESDPQLRHYFIAEHEGYSIKKSSILKRPGLGGAKQTKYPLNVLLDLLDHKAVKEKSTLMDLLSRIIQITTRPLNAMKKAQDEKSSKKKIELPEVQPSSLKNVVSMLVSDDCSSRTFQQTLSAMQNLLVIRDSKSVFSAELSQYATALGSDLVKDLNVLIEELKNSQEVSDFNADIMTKFTLPSSDQAKLLRVLTALDYLFTSKKRDNEEDKKRQNQELTEVYDKSKLGSLWGALSETLDLFESNKAITHVAATLLPLIEALMVVCKHSKVKELEAKDALKYENKKCDFANEPIESLFFSFTDTHKKILNQMVRSNSKLMSGPFAMLVRNPRVLEFDNKKNYFDRKLHSEEIEKPTLTVSTSRNQVFLDSFRALFFKSKDEFRNSKLEITFKGEAGVDAGGVTREWYQVLSRQMFNPDYALFLPVASDKTTFHPNRTSGVNPEHLSFFKFIGRIIGKAIFDNCFLDCHFSRDVYKSILGRPVSLKDLESIDLDYYKSLIWMLENDITDIIFETFAVETDDYGEVKAIDLIPDGRNISVTEENKQEYVRLVVEYRLQTSVKDQMDNFLQGFHEIIPKELISIFDEQELELLVSGLPDIDVDDWKNNTNYANYTANSQEIQYFWRAVRSFDKEERAKLLQFATGTSKVPLNGFKELEGSNGSTKFSIHKDFGSTDRLPSSHTCFNQIDLPAYDSYETLRGSLLLAITEGHEGFGLA